MNLLIGCALMLLYSPSKKIKKELFMNLNHYALFINKARDAPRLVARYL